MTAFYTLHVAPDAIPGDPEALDEAHLVKDGFTWGAAAFTFLWFFRHRLWLAGIAVMIVVVGSFIGFRALHLPRGIVMLSELILWGLIGLEASSLRRWTYARNGRPAVDIVSAPDAQAAETKAFGRWLKAETAPEAQANTGLHGYPHAGPAYGAFPASPPPAPILGLFPDPDRRR